MNLVRASLAAALLTTSRCTPGPAADSGPRVFNGIPLATNIHCSDDKCNSYRVDPAIRVQTSVSVQCMGNTPPGETPNPEPPPKSYLVSDIGKRGVPHLNAQRRALIGRIRRQLHSQTLRFAFVDDFPRDSDFIVYDATDGPCTVASLGYPVLNGACNEYYKPGEIPYATFPAPDACYRATPRPWMNDR